MGLSPLGQVCAGRCRCDRMTHLPYDPWAPPAPSDLSRWASTATLQERLRAGDLAEAAGRARDAWWCAVIATVVLVGFFLAPFVTRVNIWLLLGWALVGVWFCTAAASNARAARDARGAW